MATLSDYFNTDQTHDARITSESKVTTAGGVDVPFKMFQDFSAGAIYLAMYVPGVADAKTVCTRLLEPASISTMLSAAPGITIEPHVLGAPPIPSSSLTFCGRVFIYSENELNESEIRALHDVAKARNLHVQYFGPHWATNRAHNEKPLAFISYDSRDRDGMARPLANELARNLVPVWFDEFSLRVGDSLRGKIEKGLKECKHCVLLITPQFLSNGGWTRREFDSIFTRELLEQRNVVLPVWAGVTKKDVYEYSPSLADRFALSWDMGPRLLAQTLALRIKNEG